MSRTSSRSAAVLTALALAVTPLSAAGAADRPDTISLVTGSSPEGISAGPGTTFFAGARADGAVYVGDVREGTVRQLVAGRAGEVAVGLLYDAATKRIWVAGGGTGDITAYDSRTGAPLFTVYTGPGRFLNDVAITRDAVYVTDSTKNQILVVPLGRGASLPPAGTAARVLTVIGDYVQPTGFGLNGIRVLPGGDLLAVSGGRLYVVDPVTGVADRVEVQGATLTGGDGLELRGSTLYVVRGFNPRASVVVLRLGQGGRTATFVEEITDSDFNVPTTAALVAGDLLVVNGQFNDPATAPTEVVRIDRP
jgi:streptogramin lyase